MYPTIVGIQGVGRTKREHGSKLQQETMVTDDPLPSRKKVLLSASLSLFPSLSPINLGTTVVGGKGSIVGRLQALFKCPSDFGAIILLLHNLSPTHPCKLVSSILGTIHLGLPGQIKCDRAITNLS